MKKMQIDASWFEWDNCCCPVWQLSSDVLNRLLSSYIILNVKCCITSNKYRFIFLFISFSFRCSRKTENRKGHFTSKKSWDYCLVFQRSKIFFLMQYNSIFKCLTRILTLFNIKHIADIRDKIEEFRCWKVWPNHHFQKMDFKVPNIYCQISP